MHNNKDINKQFATNGFTLSACVGGAIQGHFYLGRAKVPTLQTIDHVLEEDKLLKKRKEKGHIAQKIHDVIF